MLEHRKYGTLWQGGTRRPLILLVYETPDTKGNHWQYLSKRVRSLDDIQTREGFTLGDGPCNVVVPLPPEPAPDRKGLQESCGHDVVVEASVKDRIAFAGASEGKSQIFDVVLKEQVVSQQSPGLFGGQGCA